MSADKYGCVGYTTMAGVRYAMVEHTFQGNNLDGQKVGFTSVNYIDAIDWARQCRERDADEKQRQKQQQEWEKSPEGQREIESRRREYQCTSAERNKAYLELMRRTKKRKAIRNSILSLTLAGTGLAIFVNHQNSTAAHQSELTGAGIIQTNPKLIDPKAYFDWSKAILVDKQYGTRTCPVRMIEIDEDLNLNILNRYTLIVPKGGAVINEGPDANSNDVFSFIYPFQVQDLKDTHIIRNAISIGATKPKFAPQ